MPAPSTEDMSIAQIMADWPQVVRVLLDRRLFCVGCPVARFHTLAQAAAAHGLAKAELETAVHAVTGDGASAAGPRPRLRQ